MSDLISRQEVLGLIDHLDVDFANSFDPHTLNEMYRCVKEMPSVENKGEWKSADKRVPLEESLLCWCSECNKASFEQTNFCPNCGADMRGE